MSLDERYQITLRTPALLPCTMERRLEACRNSSLKNKRRNKGERIGITTTTLFQEANPKVRYRNVS